MSLSVKPVHPYDLPYIWPDCAPLIGRALKYTHNEHSLETIYESLLSENRALWVVGKNGELIAAVTTRIDIYPNSVKIGVIDFAGGRDFASWSMFTDYVEPYFKAQGCHYLEIAGRKGWQRLHTAKGFKPKYFVLRKELQCQKAAEAKHQQ